MIKTVYFDMDGVLTDFFTGANNIYGMPRNDPRFEGWLREETHSGDFFLRIPPSPFLRDMKNLMIDLHNCNYNVEILTSYGGRGAYQRIEAQKRLWLIDNLGMAICDEILYFNGVTDCEYKALKAKPDTLLIDDQKSNVLDFINRGGRAVLYSFDNHEECMRQIKAIVFP